MDDKKFERLLKAVKARKAQPQNVGAVFAKAFLRDCQEDINQQERETYHE